MKGFARLKLPKRKLVPMNEENKTNPLYTNLQIKRMRIKKEREKNNGI